MSGPTLSLLGKNTRPVHGVYHQSCFPFVATIQEASAHESKRLGGKKYVGKLLLMGGGEVPSVLPGMGSKPSLVTAGSNNVPSLCEYLTQWAVKLLRDMEALSVAQVTPLCCNEPCVEGVQHPSVPAQDIAEEDLCMAKELTGGT